MCSGTISEQRRGRRDNVRAGEQVIDDLSFRFDATAGSKRARDAPRQERDPHERERQFGGRRQRERSRDSQSREVDVRCVETVEEHQSLRASPHQFRRDVRHRAEVGHQLDGDGNFHGRRNLQDDLQRAPFHLGAADSGINRDREEVELDRCGSCFFEGARVPGPSLGGGARRGSR